MKNILGTELLLSMNGNKNDKLKKKRFWFFFASVFPFGVLFIIGTLHLIKKVSVVAELNASKISEMRATSIESGAIGPAGGHSIYAIGMMDGTTERVYIGLNSNDKVKQIMGQIAKDGSVRLQIFKSDSRIIFMDDKNISSLRREYLLACLKTFAVFNIPSILLFIIGFRYHKKLKHENS